MKALWLAAAVLAVLPATAGAVDLRFPDGRVAQPYQRWADQSRMPTTSATMTVLGERCPTPDIQYVCVTGNPLTLHVDPSFPIDRTILYHELGHAFDYAVMDDRARLGFEWLVGLSGPWRAPENSPHEQFAEAYSICATGAPRVLDGGPFNARVDGGYAYRPWPRKHKRVCSLIRRQAAR